MRDFILYQKAKYRLLAPYQIRTEIAVDSPVVTRYAVLTMGLLTINANYFWDGPSGPTIDTNNFMRASLVHDVLYQLMREGHIPESCRELADAILFRLCREDGMLWIRAWGVWKAVRLFGGKFAKRQTVFTT